MGLPLNLLLYMCLCAGVGYAHQITWLPCQFTDEKVSLNEQGHIETQPIIKEAILQFGQKGEAPISPHVMTFLLTASKLDLRRYLEGAEPDQLECVVRRYSTEGIHVRWPVVGAQGYNYWFTCTLKHGDGLFTIVSFLRNPTDNPPPGQQDYRHWPDISNTDILPTTVAMVMKTVTPSVKATLGSQKKLHCQFDIDHKGANLTLEWHHQQRGERIRLYSHSSRSGLTEGSGVRKQDLARGDASYMLPFAKTSSEGSYVCSLAVMPLFATLDINLRIEEPPRVSINVGSSLSLQVGEEQKVVCTADGYYPLDVEIVWYQQDPVASAQRVGAPLPKVLPNILLSSHRHNPDKTYSVSAFFYLQASLRDAGKQFTCSVFHQALRVPIKKSFILQVEDPLSWMLVLSVGLTVVTMVGVLVVMLRYLYSARKKSKEKKPY